MDPGPDREYETGDSCAGIPISEGVVVENFDEEHVGVALCFGLADGGGYTCTYYAATPDELPPRPARTHCGDGPSGYVVHHDSGNASANAYCAPCGPGFEPGNELEPTGTPTARRLFGKARAGDGEGEHLIVWTDGSTSRCTVGGGAVALCNEVSLARE